MTVSSIPVLSQSTFNCLAFLSQCCHPVMQCQWNPLRSQTDFTVWWARPNRLTINVKHHLPHGGTHRLVESKPDFPPPTQWVVVSFRWGEEWATHWSVPNLRGLRGENDECANSEYDLSVSSFPVKLWPQKTSTLTTKSQKRFWADLFWSLRNGIRCHWTNNPSLEDFHFDNFQVKSWSQLSLFHYSALFRHFSHKSQLTTIFCWVILGDMIVRYCTV